MRYAIYFTPEETHPLTRAAARWLGRDAFSGDDLAIPSVGGLTADEIAAIGASPRRYGFHATLKAPFRLAAQRRQAGLCDALRHFAARTDAIVIPRLVLRRLDGFFALVPESAPAGLDRLEADIVAEFEPFRAPLSEADIAARNPDRLTQAQLENLHRWGYPYVHKHFRFHMTLTDRVAEEHAARIEDALKAHFAPFLGKPLAIDGLAVFAEEERGAPFLVKSYERLGAASERKIA